MKHGSTEQSGTVAYCTDFNLNYSMKPVFVVWKPTLVEITALQGHVLELCRSSGYLVTWTGRKWRPSISVMMSTHITYKFWGQRVLLLSIDAVDFSRWNRRFTTLNSNVRISSRPVDRSIHTSSLPKSSLALLLLITGWCRVGWQPAVSRYVLFVTSASFVTGGVRNKREQITGCRLLHDLFQII